MPDRQATLEDCPSTLCKVAVTDLGHDKPALLLTNQQQETPARLVDRRARRMLIEGAIDQAIDLFHRDALSVAVPFQIDVDLRFTVMAASLHHLLADRIGRGQQHQAPRTLFREFFDSTADLSIDEHPIKVRFGRCVNSPFPVQQGFAGVQCRIPSLGSRMLRLACSEDVQQRATSESAGGIEA